MIKMLICTTIMLLVAPAFALQTTAEDTSDLQILEKLQQEGNANKKYAGIATYYAASFIGKRTSSGEPYAPERLTAAHATLPLHTVVRVFNITTGQGVQVVINDRCRKRPFQLIDLSRAAAQKIGLLEKGTMPVLIIPVVENRLNELLQEVEG